MNGVRSANFYDPQAGHWATPGNNGAWLRFAPDGTYQYGGYVRKEDAEGCATAEWTYQEGTVTVSGPHLQFQAHSGRQRHENACTEEVRDEPYVDPSKTGYSWSVHDRTTAPYLAISPLGKFDYLTFEREE